jgi:hypothetical protein
VSEIELNLRSLNLDSLVCVEAFLASQCRLCHQPVGAHEVERLPADPRLPGTPRGRLVCPTAPEGRG